MIEAQKQALVQQLVAHASGIAVLHGLAGCDVIPGHLLVMEPSKDGV